MKPHMPIATPTTALADDLGALRLLVQYACSEARNHGLELAAELLDLADRNLNKAQMASRGNARAAGSRRSYKLDARSTG